MKHIATLALMLNLGVAGVDAQEKPVKMTFSGTAGDSAINLQIPDTTTSEYNFAGKGTLGSFTFRTVSASGASSSPPPGTCSGANQIYGTAKAGAGISLPGWESIKGQSDGRSRLHRFGTSRRPTGPLYQDFSNHRWNLPFQECVRRLPYVRRDVSPGVGRLFKQPRPFCRHRLPYRNGFGSRRGAGTP